MTTNSTRVHRWLGFTILAGWLATGAVAQAQGVWLGNAYQWPTPTQATPTDALWVNVETWPPGRATEVRLVNTTNCRSMGKYGIVCDTETTPLNRWGRIGNNDAWHVNIGRLLPGAYTSYSLQAKVDGVWQEPTSFDITVSPGPALGWAGNVSPFPADGTIPASTDFWVNLETWPIRSAAWISVVSRVDGGSWRTNSLRVAGQRGNNDWWHANLGPQRTPVNQGLLEYWFQITDAAGATHVLNNGGQNYRTRVKAEYIGWFGSVRSAPADGRFPIGTALPVFIESYPRGTASRGALLYSLNGGETWVAAPLSLAGVAGPGDQNDLWRADLPSQQSALGAAEGAVFRYVLVLNDGFGLSYWSSNNGLDYFARTIPNTDRDLDAMDDGWEAAAGANPALDDARLDHDNDGLQNMQEYRKYTHPHNADTDHDGLTDAQEGLHLFELVTSTNGFTWHEAYSNAAHRLGHLATIATFEQWDTLLRTPSTFDARDVPAWIGATNSPADATFTWITREPMTFTAWRTPGPPIRPEEKLAAYLTPVAGSNATWFAMNVTNRSPAYVLERVVFSDPRLWDTDSDGMRDGWEVRHGLNPMQREDGALDPDGDGFTNVEEHGRDSNPWTAD